MKFNFNKYPISIFIHQSLNTFYTVLNKLSNDSHHNVHAPKVQSSKVNIIIIML